MKKLDWNNSHLISGDFISELRKLKAQGSGVMGMTGSVQLVQVLLQANLVDELHLFVHPIIVGTGKRLYADGVQHKLQLVSTRQFIGRDYPQLSASAIRCNSAGQQFSKSICF